MADESFGTFIGRLLLEALDDGRKMRLVEEYRFRDAAGRDWTAPANAIVDGASIPRALWTLIGGPFEGKYRNASVIHDWYCDTRSRPWRDVHRVFHDAMRAAGVGGLRAKVMYAAVYHGGPRWDDGVVANVNLPGAVVASAAETLPPFAQALLAIVRDDARPGTRMLAGAGDDPGEFRLAVADLEALIARDDPSPETIAAGLDDLTARSPDAARVIDDPGALAA